MTHLVVQQYKEQLIKVIAPLVKKGMDSGLVVQSVYDPRLQMLYPDQWTASAHDPFFIKGISKEINELLDAIHGGANKDGHNANMADVFNRVIDYQYNENYKDNFKYFLDNDIPSDHSYPDANEAHELLQLVNWARHGINAYYKWDACDPSGDPFPLYKNGSSEDPLDSNMMDYVPLGKFHKNGIVGNLFKNKDNKYFLVFGDSTISDINQTIASKNLDFSNYLNQSYHMYRSVLKEYKIRSSDVTFLAACRRFEPVTL